jgi:hypothetical protein
MNSGYPPPTATTRPFTTVFAASAFLEFLTTSRVICRSFGKLNTIDPRLSCYFSHLRTFRDSAIELKTGGLETQNTTYDMASPPITPVISRRQSGDYFASSPITRVASSTHSRHSSQAYSPAHSRMGSSHASDNLANELSGFGESLADELGGWGEEDEDEEEDEDFSEEDEHHEGHGGQRERDSGIDVTSSPATKENGKLLTVVTRSAKGHRRKGSEYDGSEYGSESDFEDAQLVNASLEARLAAVESLARRGTGDISGIENTIGRATKQLQDLGGQSTMETGTSRYVVLVLQEFHVY